MASSSCRLRFHHLTVTLEIVADVVKVRLQMQAVQGGPPLGMVNPPPPPPSPLISPGSIYSPFAMTTARRCSNISQIRHVLGMFINIPLWLHGCHLAGVYCCINCPERGRSITLERRHPLHWPRHVLRRCVIHPKRLPIIYATKTSSWWFCSGTSFIDSHQPPTSPHRPQPPSNQCSYAHWALQASEGAAPEQQSVDPKANGRVHVRGPRGHRFQPP